MTEWIESEQGVEMYKKVGLTENTFFRNVREGKISKKIEGNQKRGAQYNLEDIKKITQSRALKNKMRAEAIKDIDKREENGITDWVQNGDLPYLLALDYEMYGIEEAVDLSITYAWYEKNSNICRVVYNSENRKDIWGYVNLMPMEEETIIRLLKREMHERDIKSVDILPYEKGKTYNVYATSVVIRSDKRNYIRKLFSSIINYWCDKKDDFSVSKIYAYADSEEGWSMIKQLFFAPRYDIGPRVFELDVRAPNPAKIITAFQECLKKDDTNVDSR